ncbi:YdcF family protein [Paeniglutamicibacter sp. R2-26]|uniref:YdcF family protein n=1 Tax=Paeniglutamicibacter sp. R2-26 TaxID=3144417 RepID=UPI003EE5BDB9
MSLIPAVLLFALYIHLRRKDRRMLRNGVVLVAACFFALGALGEFLSRWFPEFSLVVLLLLAMVPLAILVLAATLVRNGLVMMRSEGRSLGNLMSLVLGILLVVLPAVAVALVLSLNAWAIGLAALLFFLCSYFGVVFVVFLSYAVAYGRMPGLHRPAGIVVLGSRLIDGQVPPLLRSRLDRAVELYKSTDPRPVVIPSGGQGHDESRAEGTAMAEYLRAAGVDPADILVEDQAVNTEQNLRLSSGLFAASGRTGPLVAVTNNYHVLRAALLARSLKLDAEVLGAPTARYYLPSAFLREFVAILVEHKWLHLLLCIPFIGLTALLITAILAQG